MTSVDPNPPPPFPNDNINEADDDELLTPNNVPIDENDDVPTKLTPISTQPPESDEQARKLFQRLWTDEDEIGLLQGFLDYSTQRGTFQNNPHDTALFYDQIKPKLQLHFNKNQLVEKLRRLKKKYRNVLARISTSGGKDVSFKSAHDQSTFEIACKIWGNSVNCLKDHKSFNQQLLQRRIDVDDDMPPNYNSSGTNVNLNFATRGGYDSGHCNDRVVVDERRMQHKSSKKRIRERAEDVRVLTGGAGMGLSTPAMNEEKPKIKISSLLREMYEGAGGRGFVDGIVCPMPLSFASPVKMFGMEGVDDRWRKQQIMELEVYSKRLELFQEQIKLTLEELRSTGN